MSTFKNVTLGTDVSAGSSSTSIGDPPFTRKRSTGSSWISFVEGLCTFGFIIVALVIGSTSVCVGATNAELKSKINDLSLELTALEKEVSLLRGYISENSSLLGVGASTTTATGDVVFPILFSRGLVNVGALESSLMLPLELDFVEMVAGPSSLDGGKEAFYSDGKLIVYADNANVLVNGTVAYVRAKPNGLAVSGNDYLVQLSSAVGVDVTSRKTDVISLNGMVTVP